MILGKMTTFFLDQVFIKTRYIAIWLEFRSWFYYLFFIELYQNKHKKLSYNLYLAFGISNKHPYPLRPPLEPLRLNEPPTHMSKKRPTGLVCSSWNLDKQRLSNDGNENIHHCHDVGCYISQMLSTSFLLLSGTVPFIECNYQAQTTSLTRWWKNAVLSWRRK